ncbi:MaoC/PaaZ C-terminal domain-containing protein [Propioniciclava soli]|uniref:MaoC/PaaZ C-terminal domain-containing protein n=1 Tax=Propioniciclava soli TaxID=2775081 RepID=UPI001E4785F9|nr:MaoC/PaaZ C-terminal domain-containing protein [Propioniciclava soli]
MHTTLAYADLPAVAPLLVRATANHVGRRPRAEAVLPTTVVRVARLRQDLGRLAAYNRVCGFGLRDAVPPTWLHVLTFPLQAALLAGPDFPFTPAGLVHTANTMTLHRPVAVGDHLDVLVRAEALRPHAKGALFDLVGEVRVGSELAWSGRSSYLARGASAPAGADAAGATGVTDDPAHPLRSEAAGEQPRTAQRWRLPADLGRQYAKVSGDVNPIHLSAATAKLFGFRRAIVHGMWTHARCLAALSGRLPETYTVDVAFTRPILLPGRVSFAAAESDAGVRFAVLGREEKPHLVGAVRR